MAFFTLERDNHLQNPSKLSGKQMDKVRRIVHPKLRPFHFQIKTFYLSDVNYSTDKPSVSIVSTAIERKYRRRVCL